ncbi:MAG TPA: hypothetical protein VHX43_09560 [Xanthobacteraceae bacterium]|jgi:hypothetical protein|nr:hypothetical protein [Xanthobacteraceae bacterium]
MTKHKQKSSGWRPADKRRPYAETNKRLIALQDARFKADSDRQELWRSCPAARCRRKRACAVDPYRCTKERGGKNAPAGKNTPSSKTAAAPQTPAPAANEAPRFAISAKEAAAIIKADVEAHLAAHGNDPDGLLRGGF